MVRNNGRDLKKLLEEASQALARLDAERLEELALSCAELVSNAHGEKVNWRSEHLALEVSGIRRELSSFGRIVEATSANVGILRDLRDRGAAPLNYSLQTLRPKMEVVRGDH